jgi:Ca2+/Na+ antiporter
VVVVAVIARHESPLAMGNILGSSISNTIGAFGLGLIFSLADESFDRSSKIYTAILLALTSFFALYMLLPQTLGRVGGGVLVAIFIFYIFSIAWAIYEGIVTPPEDDDDADSESGSDSDLMTMLL